MAVFICLQLAERPAVAVFICFQLAKRPDVAVFASCLPEKRENDIYLSYIYICVYVYIFSHLYIYIICASNLLGWAIARLQYLCVCIHILSYIYKLSVLLTIWAGPSRGFNIASSAPYLLVIFHKKEQGGGGWKSMGEGRAKSEMEGPLSHPSAKHNLRVGLSHYSL